MDEVKQYSDQWNASAEYFFKKKYYQWMCNAINPYKVVLEVGCGTGYSTLALVQSGHKVIAVDKNHNCIEAAKALLYSSNIQKDTVHFYEGDVIDVFFRHVLLSNKFDVVICWNIGTYWNVEMMHRYIPCLLKYGLNIEQIKQNPESSYAELIIWESCRLARSKNTPISIIDRSIAEINSMTDHYYYKLKDEFGYKTINYDNFNAVSLSNKGRVLSTNGQVNMEDEVDIVFTSILIT